MKMPSLRRMMPGHKRGMGTTAKVLLFALPVAAYMAGKMMGSRTGRDDNTW